MMKLKFYLILTACLSLPSLALLAQPANDNACDALEIQLDAAAVIVSNLGATVEAGEQSIVPPNIPLLPLGDTPTESWYETSSPSGGPMINHSLWFKFIAPSTTAVNIDICASTFNTQMALYEASDCADFSTYTMIRAVEEISGCGIDGTSSKIRIECLEVGMEYMILVDDWQAEAGDPLDTGEVEIFIETVEKIDPGINYTNEGQVGLVFCPGGSDASLNVMLITGVLPITFEWSHGATTEDAYNLSMGTYTVTATDFCGSSVPRTYEVLDPEPPFDTITFDYLTDRGVVHPTHCGDETFGGQILVELDEGIGPFDYVWSTGDTLGIISDLADGAYTVTVTDYCRLDSAERTYYVGMEAGPDFNYDQACLSNPIGLDHAETGGSVQKITYNTDQSLQQGIACRSQGYVSSTATWRAFDLANDFGISEPVDVVGVEVFIDCEPNVITNKYFNSLEEGVPVKFTAYLANTTLLDSPGLTLDLLDEIETSFPKYPGYKPYLIPLEALDFSPTDILVIKVETLTETRFKHRLDFGANLSPTAQATYITSESCNIDTPLNLDSIDLQEEIVMNIFLSENRGLTYQWSGPVDDPSSPTPTPLGTQSENIYTVTITDEACGLTRTDQVVVNCAWTNATEELAKVSFSLHPNPSDGYLQVQASGERQASDCRIYNLQGQEIWRKRVALGDGQAVNLDLEEIPPGIYWMLIANDAGSGLRRFVIQ